MKRVLSATEYERALQALSPDELQREAKIVADAARKLMARHGLHRTVILCGGPLRKVGALAAELLNASISYLYTDECPDLSDCLICDMLFGSEADEGYAAWVENLAFSGCPVLSVGIPAGVDPDTGKAHRPSLRAEMTVSPVAYLRGLFLHDGLDHCGEIWPTEKETQAGEGVYRFEDGDAQRLLPPRKRTAHKGDSGKALLCVGSSKYVGAALLSARACLAAGCGILFVACPNEVRMALGRLPEAIGIPVGVEWNEDSCRLALRAMDGMKAVGLGCGIGDGDVSLLIKVALLSKLPMVLDADGLNCLSRHPELYPLLHERAVMTPHPGEMGRLTGMTPQEILDDPIALAQRYARLWGCVVLLKGAATVVSNGHRTRIVAEGNAGLGKGGSGDVLTGIITGLLSQGIKPFDAACLGSYLLGTSAQRAFELLKERMLRATNVIDALEDWSK